LGLLVNLNDYGRVDIILVHKYDNILSFRAVFDGKRVWVKEA
jgi:hypothetical protein